MFSYKFIRALKFIKNIYLKKFDVWPNYLENVTECTIIAG